MTTVLIIRHGEKHQWPFGNEPSMEMIQNYVDDHLLSAKGEERAQALVGYFTKRNEILELYKERPLKALVAQKPAEKGDSGKSCRPRDTLVPLSKYLEMDIEVFLKKDVSKAVKFIKEQVNATVIVSWSHQNIPGMVKEFGIEQVPDWPRHRYDMVWIVRLDPGQAPRLIQLPQCLLYGDAPLIK